MRRRGERTFRSFTLIEVTLGLAIMVLIFGVIFQLVQMSVLGADAAAKNSLRSREVGGLFALVRQLCLDLPVRSQVGLEPRTGMRGYDLVFSNAPLLILPDPKEGNRSVRFSLKRDPLGRDGILVLEEIFQSTNIQRRQEPPQTNAFELMKGVVSVTWRAGDPRNPDELQEWNDGMVKPAYLRLVLVRRGADGDVTNTGIFWIPTGLSPSGQPPVDPVTRFPMGGGSVPGTAAAGTSPAGGAQAGGSVGNINVTIPQGNSSPNSFQNRPNF